MLDHALRLAGLGWRVFPIYEPIGIEVCSCPSGPDCGRDCGKHPRTLHGAKDATTDESQIRDWWRRWPRANIAVALLDQGFFVVDVDPRHGGDAIFTGLVRQHEPLPQTVCARTGSQGWHVLFRRPTGVKLRGKLKRGVDLPTTYFLVAPSLHLCGHLYEWIRSPFDHPIAEAPAWLIDLASAARACVASEGGRPPGEATHARRAGAGFDTSDSGEDAREAARLARHGVTDAEIANELRTRPSYQKRLSGRGEGVAEQYLQRTVAFARGLPDRAVRAIVTDVRLDVRSPLDGKPAIAVLKLALATSTHGEVLPRDRIVVPSLGREHEGERFRATCPDLDIARLVRGERDYARLALVGCELDVVVEGGKITWSARVR